MRIIKFLVAALVTALLTLQSTVNTGCSKPEDNRNDTIVPPPPPPPPPDTISLVKKIEVITSFYPSYVLRPYYTFSFYYDNQKRVTAVGVKTYVSFLHDSLTTRLFYTGNNNKPDYIIMADIKSPVTEPPFYDTCWFTYNGNGTLLKDSTNERWYHFPIAGYIRKPLVRHYTYLSATTAKTDWVGSYSSTGPEGLVRRDTVKLTGNNSATIKAQYVPDPSFGLGSYALAQGFQYSPTINPLAKLNISGTPYSLIYSNVKNEVLGNQYHPLVYNSNGFAEYLDFISPTIPTVFYISAYNRLDQMISSSGAGFSVQITPWTARPSYPAELRIIISNSLAGDSYYYRYYY